MMHYYYITAGSDEEGLLMGLQYKSDHRARSFLEGIKFENTPDAKPWRLPPAEPIIVTIDPSKDYEGAPMPTLSEHPIPLINQDLYDVLKSCGVNMDTYKAELRHIDGSVVSDNYFVFHLLDVISGVDLKKSKQVEPISSKEIDMAFSEVTIDKKIARDFSMFRLKENISSVFVNQKIKDAIEQAGIKLIRFHDVADVALL